MKEFIKNITPERIYKKRAKQKLKHINKKSSQDLILRAIKTQIIIKFQIIKPNSKKLFINKCQIPKANTKMQNKSKALRIMAFLR